MSEASKANLTPMRRNGHRGYCIAFGCLNSKKKDPALSFFKLPPQPERREKWLALVGREDLLKKDKINHTSYTVCMSHFDSSVVNVRVKRMLRDNALPTRFLPADEEIKNKLLGNTGEIKRDPEIFEPSNHSNEGPVLTTICNSDIASDCGFNINYEKVETIRRTTTVESYAMPINSVYVEESHSENGVNKHTNESPMTAHDYHDDDNINYKYNISQNYYDKCDGVVIEFIDEITSEPLVVSNLTLARSIHIQTEPLVRICKSTQTGENIEVFEKMKMNEVDVEVKMETEEIDMEFKVELEDAENKFQGN